jgi:hypothetical protein
LEQLFVPGDSLLARFHSEDLSRERRSTPARAARARPMTNYAG